MRGDFALVLLDVVLTVFTYLLLFALRFDFSVPEQYWNEFQIFLPVACLVSVGQHVGVGLLRPHVAPRQHRRGPAPPRRGALTTGVRPRPLVHVGLRAGAPHRAGRRAGHRHLPLRHGAVPVPPVRVPPELVHEHRRARRGRRRRHQRRGGAPRDAAVTPSSGWYRWSWSTTTRRCGAARSTACRSPGRSTTSPRIVADHDVHQILLAIAVAHRGGCVSSASPTPPRRPTSRCASCGSPSSLGARHAAPARHPRPEHRRPPRPPSRSTSTSSPCASCCTDAGTRHRRRRLDRLRDRPPGRRVRSCAAGAPRPRRDPPPRHRVRRSRASPIAEVVLADIRDASAIDAVFRRVRPEVVFHAAAHKHVPDPRGATRARPIRTNVFGTLNVIDACARGRHASQLVCISTDKAATPTSVMGASKWLAEQIVLDARRPTTATARCASATCSGVAGSVIPTFQRQIAAGGPVTVTDPRMTRYFMSTDEAVRLVLLARGSLPGDHQVLALEMGEQVNIYALAERMIRLCGLRPHDDIEIKVTGTAAGREARRVADRPGRDQRRRTTGHCCTASSPRRWVRRSSPRASSSSNGSPSTTTMSPRARCSSTSRVRPRATSDRTPTPRSACVLTAAGAARPAEPLPPSMT